MKTHMKEIKTQTITRKRDLHTKISVYKIRKSVRKYLYKRIKSV